MAVRRSAQVLRLGALVGALAANHALAAPAVEGPVEGPAPPPERGDAPDAATSVSPEDGQGGAPSKALPPPRLEFDGPMPESADDRGRANLGLRRQTDGSYLYVDPYRRFSAEFNPDGTVQFADRWRRPDSTKSQRGSFGGPPVGLFTPMGMSVTGPAEWVMALQGIDRNARAKAELLARTREIRIALAVSFTKELLAVRLGQLEGELAGIWSLPSLSVAQRRALLFQRWDECDESFAVEAGEVPEEALSEIDRTRLETADKARRQIEAFIRATLPRGRKDAYTDEELRALNRRRQSRQPFAPYDQRPTPDDT